jgi:pectin methylesterase-like acyl-CoA thioesterase
VPLLLVSACCADCAGAAGRRTGCPQGDGKPGCSNSTADKACLPQHSVNGRAVGIRGVETLLVEALDFIALNISVANDACGYNSHVAGQSETVQLLADRIAFRHTRLMGAQDTIFAAGPMAGSRQYFLQSYVNGSCDSIYGTSSMVFEECEIAITDSITAHRGTKFGWNPARGDRSFYYFINSSLVKPEKGGRP